jgi:hypothetical protein
MNYRRAALEAIVTAQDQLAAEIARRRRDQV